jgi:two-component system response regulator MprA
MAATDSEEVAILVVEDDPGVAAVLRRALSFEGYRVRIAATGPQAIEEVALEPPALMVLDVMIPGMDGLEVARRIREGERRQQGDRLPILMLTARDAIADRVRGLDSGADDYLIKPFALDELLARVRALLRRRPQAVDAHRAESLAFDDVTLEVLSRTVRRGEREVQLTPKEFELLALFLRNPNIVLTRAQIMERIWGEDYWGESNVLEVFVASLRRELEAAGEPRLIQTVRGVGYVLRRPPDAP